MLICGISFSYEITLLLDHHTNLIYSAAKVSEWQRVKRCGLILKEFMLRQLPSAYSDWDKLGPSKAQCHANEIFAIEVKSTSDEDFPLVLSKVFIKQKKVKNLNKKH